MSVFYNVLMEKSAQRQEREDQQQGLSLGQKAGVGAAGLAGTIGGQIGLGLAGKASPTFGNYMSTFHGGEAYQAKKRSMEASREAALDSLEKTRKLPGLYGSVLSQNTLDQLDATLGSGEIHESVQPLFKKRRDHLAKALEAESAYRADYDDALKAPLDKHRDAFRGTSDEIFEAMKKERGNINSAYEESERALKEGMHQRVRNINRGAALGGALAFGYGAKKLFDRYNANKQTQSSAV
jgi:hypothetical protein